MIAGIPMELKFYLYCLADLALILTSFIYGVKFFAKRNYLLGIESVIVTFSATNLMINALTGVKIFLSISLFCDAFSRSFGAPVIAVAGMMAVTHRYKPSMFADAMYLIGALIGAAIVWNAGFMVEPKPYFYLVMWTLLSCYLAYVAVRLFKIGKALNAINMILVLIYTQAIASIYDFYHIPGDSDHVIFYIFALFAWSHMSVSLYYAYSALERAQEKEVGTRLRYAA
jgi:hypothetical protein